MRYSASTPDTRAEMLAAVGASSIEDLIASIPSDVLDRRAPKIAGPWPESDLVARLDGMKGERPRVSLVGAGLYSHYVPTPVDSLCARSEWVTSYTPYQAEVSQGTLVMYYEFQSYIAMLTGAEIANAGMYDGSTALAEAVLMAHRLRPKADPVVYVSEALHPEYVAVLRTYLRFLGTEIATLPVDAESGRTRIDSVDADALASATAVLLQSPNVFGIVDDIDGLPEKSFSIAVVTEAMSMALLKPPAADIIVGECQSFGIPMQLGGPTAGFFATRKQWVRKMPGRLVGRTKDADDNEAFCITLATREQFIRREKATSNICTSSGLMCLRATVYLSLMGRKGLEDVARKNVAAARYLAEGLEAMGLPRVHKGAFFNEFVIDASSKPGLYEALQKSGIVLGLPLECWFPERKHQYLVTATELHYRDAESILEEIKNLAAAS